MIRDPAHDRAWFDRWITFDEHEIAARQQDLLRPSGHPSYRPQFVFDLAMTRLRTLLRRYGRGDPVGELVQHLPPLIDAWEQAWALGDEAWSAEERQARHAWSAHLDNYVRAFWIVGLAQVLGLDDPHWQRLLVLVGNEGEDALLDRVIATRQPGRRIGASLCHPAPYAGLLEAVTAPPAQRPALLARFVKGWYAGLERRPARGMSPSTVAQRAWWHGNDDTEGAYFGYWCVEAVAVARAFDIDDSACLGLRHYPGDLVRPDGAGTHGTPGPAVAPAASWASRLRQRLPATRR